MGILRIVTGKRSPRPEGRIRWEPAQSADERSKALEAENRKHRLEALCTPRIWL